MPPYYCDGYFFSIILLVLIVVFYTVNIVSFTRQSYTVKEGNGGVTVCLTMNSGLTKPIIVNVVGKEKVPADASGKIHSKRPYVHEVLL